jgi:hypothetical protein
MVVKVEPDVDNLPQPIEVSTLDGKTGWYAKDALVVLSDAAVSSMASSSGVGVGGVAPIEDLALSVDSIADTCRVVHPLSVSLACSPALCPLPPTCGRRQSLLGSVSPHLSLSE